MSYGLGDWRNERRGMFGAFRMATVAEERAWDAFADGTGPLPGETPDMPAVRLAAE